MNTLIQIFIIAIALSLDAVSVSIATGMRVKKQTQREALRLALFFGGFQALMPVVGWLVGSALRDAVSSVAEPIACVLLVGIGMKMIVESFQSDEVETKVGNRKLFGLAIATSIDALVVGTSLRFVDFPLGLSVLIIGTVTAILCYVAYLMSRHLGKLFGSRVELVGGIVLIVIGVSILFR